MSLDKLKAVILHNEANISIWFSLERNLNLIYEEEQAEKIPYVKEDLMKKLEE